MGKELKLSGGIGIVPYFMDEAQKYFAAEKQKADRIERLTLAVKKANSKPKEIKIKSVETKRTGIVKVDIEEI